MPSQPFPDSEPSSAQPQPMATHQLRNISQTLRQCKLTRKWINAWVSKMKTLTHITQQHSLIPWIFKDKPASKILFNLSTTLCWSSCMWTLPKTSLQWETHETVSEWYCLRSLSSGTSTAKFSHSLSSKLTFCKVS